MYGIIFNIKKKKKEKNFAQGRERNTKEIEVGRVEDEEKKKKKKKTARTREI